MPSMHVADSVVVAFWTIRAFAWRGAAAALYPLAMTTAVMYLGEHYALDAIGGVLVDSVAIGAALLLERALQGRAVARSRRLVYSPALTPEYAMTGSSTGGLRAPSEPGRWKPAAAQQPRTRP